MSGGPSQPSTARSRKGACLKSGRGVCCHCARRPLKRRRSRCSVEASTCLTFAYRLHAPMLNAVGAVVTPLRWRDSTSAATFVLDWVASGRQMAVSRVGPPVAGGPRRPRPLFFQRALDGVDGGGGDAIVMACPAKPVVAAQPGGTGADNRPDGGGRGIGNDRHAQRGGCFIGCG